MDRFEHMVRSKCEQKDFEDHEYVVKQLIAFSQDVERITKRHLPRKRVIKKVLKNLDKVSFTLKYIPIYLKTNEGGIYYWIDGAKGIEVVDPEKEYTLIHELIHDLAVNSRNHGIRMKGKYDNNTSLDDGMVEHITELIWKNRYPNAESKNRFKDEVNFAVKIFGLLGEERGVILYLTNAKRIIKEIKKLNLEEYNTEQEWDDLNKNLDKLRMVSEDAREVYITNAKKSIQMLYLAKHKASSK